MKYIDIHCHLDFPDYGTEISDVLARMRESNVGAITIGTDLESSKSAVKIAEENENIWACIGVHPREASPPNPLSEGEGEALPFGEGGEGLFEHLSHHPKVVAIGECGLDWFRIDPAKLREERVRQTRLFEKQIELALNADKPLMLHCRESYDDVIEVLKRYKNIHGDKLRGNAHFFAGTIEQAKKFLDLGFTMSFTGVITFTHDYDEVIRYLPEDSIMSETDAPFVAPVPYRGKRNEPVFVMEVSHKIAEIRGVDREIMCQKLIQNAKRVFGV